MSAMLGSEEKANVECDRKLTSRLRGDAVARATTCKAMSRRVPPSLLRSTDLDHDSELHVAAGAQVFQLGTPTAGAHFIGTPVRQGQPSHGHIVSNPSDPTSCSRSSSTASSASSYRRAEHGQRSQSKCPQQTHLAACEFSLASDTTRSQSTSPDSSGSSTPCWMTAQAVPTEEAILAAFMKAYERRHPEGDLDSDFEARSDSEWSAEG
eukprot:TRINITY_DN77536_c0_g1_i1.p1 TRINITY_DN77536_c0_g1~~TRINITY_DN77536_c0_g1_i1.p1  ORF type:complete len:209 (-),score=25.91 TRINITY_DN77536_c0_g1_i1:338-964(-)